MFSTTIKRSVATLGVVAGLLAAAGPASAMPIYMKFDGVDGAVVAEEPQGTDASLGRENSIESLRDGTSNTVQFAETGRSDAKTPSLIAKGTQVGSEGVKAPTKTDEQMKDNVKAAVVLNGANAYGWTEGNNTPYDDGLGIRGDAQDTQTSRTSSLKDTMVSGYNVKAWHQTVVEGQISAAREPAQSAIIVYDFEGEAVKGNNGAPGR